MQQKMKERIKKHIGILVMGVIALVMAGCSKGELHGDLEGNWEVMQVTDPGGADMEVIHQRYYSIMRNVIQLRIYGDRITTGALTYAEPYLTLSFPYAEELETYPLKEWWILENPVTMRVEKLDKKSLVLNQNGYKIYLRRF